MTIVVDEAFTIGVAVFYVFFCLLILSTHVEKFTCVLYAVFGMVNKKNKKYQLIRRCLFITKLNYNIKKMSSFFGLKGEI